MSILPTKEQAQKLVDEHVKDTYQKLHVKMVANVMEAYAKKLGEDSNLWYVTGLLHDLDYYEYPQEHPKKSLEWFKEWNYPEELIHAIEAHACHYGTNVEPKTKMASCLCAVDELCGFLYAYSLMRPTGWEGMEASSVKKKFKDKAFAAKISREDVNFGVEKFGVEFGEVASFLIDVFSQMLELRHSEQ